MRTLLYNCELHETVGEFIGGLTPQPEPILISLIFSAFQRTLAISPQFIAGRESNTKPRF